MATEVVKMKKSDEIAAALNSGAEVHRGIDTCKQKVLELLKEFELPRGLLPVEGIEECGCLKNTGFVWMKRSNKLEYRYQTTGTVSSYGPEVTAYVERGKMTKIRGVKVRELLVWMGLTELSIDDPASGMIFCKTAVGVGKNVPIKSFEEEYDKYMV